VEGALHDLLVGRVLVDRYRVEEVVGRGGMGVVFRATDLRLERPVALKIVSIPDGMDAEGRDELRRRLRREAAAAARIPPHPNVVQVYDHGTDPDLRLDFITMELLQGMDLHRVLRRGGLPRDRAVRVLQEAARGVAAGHRAGLLHRDVKPGNIFLVGGDDLEGVKILDFGIAKALEVEDGDGDDLTRHSAVPHSPAYASPEQRDAERSLTPASDVYQLGLVAYEVLTGSKPYTEEERERIRSGAEIPPGSSERWDSLDPELRGVVERALRRHPEQRHADAAEFASALSAALDDDATAYFPSEPGHDPSRWDVSRDTDRAPAPPVAAHRGTHRGGLPLALALTLGLGVLLLVWSLARPGEPGVDGSDPLAAEAPLEGSPEDSREEAFRALFADAHRNLADSASADEGDEAAEAVQAVVGNLHQTLVHGELDSHLSLYAERVDFHGERTRRDGIASARREILRRYPERETVLTQVAIHFFAPGEARALVDREWRFEGDDVWTGAAREEFVLNRIDGEWLIVAEMVLESVEERGG
jgi:serine/threonine protein kinase